MSTRPTVMPCPRCDTYVTKAEVATHLNDGCPTG